MRTTLREKLILWVNGIFLALGIELAARTSAGMATVEGMLIIAATIGAMMLATTYLLRRP
ncbi:hypothetical protein [Candidatus Chloroploca asiatica]|uniref:Uncharacterized protein n=1 Tax=Candidatus Chloroploca asiatica TaxID=1506545 RepID=A0A2H3KGZ8_9CHLR|nr:hypothetical protein [Candidatus Chloroploca asiatica]PDV97009.1 hypothetical protein A9Q02_05620 [Candidatus Chloroploca asiatica]